MRSEQKGDEKLIGFCSAPWTDCITYADGSLKACDRNVASFGNWQELGLKKAWESEKFQEFRRAMSEGRYPDQDCASCHNNGTQRTAMSSLIGAFSVHYAYLKGHLGKEIPELSALLPLLSLKKKSETSDAVLAKYFSALNRIQAENLPSFTRTPDFHNAIVKLRVIGESLEDYLKGELKPRRVATFRQSQLQAKCTARCVMCAGKYTGEIVDGPTMDTKYVDEAFAEIEDVTDFWCNGAEYLFYKEWKKIALMLAKEGTKLRVSTNGILLNEAAIDFMIDNRILAFLTMSLDAATKETMESTRVRVNYEKNMQRIKYLLKKATEKKQYFEFTAAFVMMKRNLHELPDFVRLMKSLMPPDCLPMVTVLCQPLENFNVEDYRRFVHREHHVQVGNEELRRIFQEVHKAHLETGVQVSFYNEKIADFMAAGMPFPRYFPRQMDVDLFLADLRSGTSLLDESKIDFQVIADRVGRDALRFEHELEQLISSHFLRDHVIQQTAEEFPAFLPAAKALFPNYAKAWAARLAKETARVEFGGLSLSTLKYALKPELESGANLVEIVSWPEFTQEADTINYQELAEKNARDPEKIKAELLALTQKRWSESDVIRKAQKDFPAFAREAPRLMAAYAAEWFKRIESETQRSISNGYLIYMRRYVLRRFRPGDRVYSFVSQRPGLILKTAGRLALMHDGSVVPTDASMRQLNSVVFDTSGREPPPFGRAPGMRATFILCIAYAYILVSAVKDRLLGNRKSLLLWRLSVAYRAVLSLFGVEAKPVLTGPKQH